MSTTALPKRSRGLGIKVLAVVGALALVVVLLRIGSLVYANATKDSRWQEESRGSCAALLAVLGGSADQDSLTVTELQHGDDEPTYRVDGGSLKGQAVYCLNFVSPVDKKVAASHVFLLDGGKPIA